jgi:transcriptional regulator with XRE-family HTH domain
MRELIRARVRELREERNWSAQDLSDHLSEQLGVDISRSMLANYENGRRPDLTASEFIALAQVFGVSLVEMCTPEDELLQTRSKSGPAVVAYGWRRQMEDLQEQIAALAERVNALTDQPRKRRG